MSGRRKVCVVLTTRGNYGKMKSPMRAIRAHPGLELQLVVAGGILLPRHGDYARVIEDDGFTIDRRVYFLIEGDDPTAMAKSAGLATIEVAHTLDVLRPDVILVIADRYEALAIAMAAACLNIPIAHLEGGEISGSMDERLRHAISKLAHLHFPANAEAAERLRRMGEWPESIVVVGSPSLDLLADVDLDDVSVLDRAQRLAGEGERIDFGGDYLVVSQHSVVTEYGAAAGQLEETASAVEALGLPTAWIWPNMDAGADLLREGIRRFGETHKSIHHFPSLPFEMYAVLLKNARCFVGNSSSGIRECDFLGVPVVNVGTRQDSRQRGPNVVDVPYDRTAIVAAVRAQVAAGSYPPGRLYGDGRAGARIAETLAGYEFKKDKRIAY